MVIRQRNLNMTTGTGARRNSMKLCTVIGTGNVQPILFKRDWPDFTFVYPCLLPGPTGLPFAKSASLGARNLHAVH